MAKKNADVRIVQQENGDVFILQRPKVVAARKLQYAAEFAQKFALEESKKRTEKLTAVAHP